MSTTAEKSLPGETARAIPERATLDRTVRALGVVSLLNDLSSEVTVRTLPLFLAVVGTPLLTWNRMSGRFWGFIGILVLFTLGNSSDAFLMLRAQTLGLSTVEIFLLVAAFNLVIALTSTKGGALSDTLGRRGLIVAGWLIYAMIYLGFALASEQWHAWLLYAGYGLYYGAFLGSASALVADLVPEHLRGTAYGIFNAALGIAAFPASLLAGLVWDAYGPSAPFFLGSALALMSSVGILLIPTSRR